MKFICVLISVFILKGAFSKDTYKAAVFEHHPMKSQNVYADFSNNLRIYLEQLEHAAYQDVDIIVFPENGLTGWVIDIDALPYLSTEIPNPNSLIAPCTDRSENYTNYLIELSCACKRHQIYSVVNIIEVVNENGGKKIYHNTNIALNRDGVIIARYRKINLYDEQIYAPGLHTAVSTFTTDFGVTFGMFICFDIVFEYPAFNVLKDNTVTDIVYSTAWFAQLPFYIANSVQHGFAKLNGINVLAAGLNNPQVGMTGSGIYLADGSIISQFITGQESSKLLIADVPKIKSKQDLSDTCQHATFDTTSSFANNVHLLHINPTDLSNYTIKSLNVDDLKISETLCAENNNFCCTFNVTFNKYLPGVPNHSYRLAVYDGVSAVSLTKTIGIRLCAIVTCGNDSLTSCVQRSVIPPTGVYFEHISITGTFDTNNAEYLPSTVTYNLLPTNQYVYCKKTTKDKVDVSMYTSQKLEGLLTFGILGRTFENDDKPPGVVTDSANYNNVQIYWLCLTALILFQ